MSTADDEAEEDDVSDVDAEDDGRDKAMTPRDHASGPSITF